MNLAKEATASRIRLFNHPVLAEKIGFRGLPPHHHPYVIRGGGKDAARPRANLVSVHSPICFIMGMTAKLPPNPQRLSIRWPKNQDLQT